MKTNLTKKQIKKIQNGKLAIFKDIDTAEAREYLLNVLDWLFPNDTSSISAKKIEIREYVYLHLSKDISNYWHGTLNNANIPTIPLSQIMYSYSPEKFEAKSMPCTEEQWNNDLKPVVEAFGIDFSGVWQWEVCDRITNNYGKGKIIGCYFDTMDKHGKLLPTYSQTEFLEACGIVRVDKERERLPKIIITHNSKAGSWVLEAFKELHTITTDQIKTARANPETLEKIFPKVFEKPVVEVGKWYRNGDTSHKKSVAFLTDYNKSTNHYKGYGFDIDGNWNNGNDNYVWGSYNWIEATLSDLQPLFEAEFNKRYKEGDLLGCVKTQKQMQFKDISFSMFNEIGSIYTNGYCIFSDGNFAKVIKSADLIKAEEELEQAYIKVESLKNR